MVKVKMSTDEEVGKGSGVDEEVEVGAEVATSAAARVDEHALVDAEHHIEKGILAVRIVLGHAVGVQSDAPMRVVAQFSRELIAARGGQQL